MSVAPTAVGDHASVDHPLKAPLRELNAEVDAERAKRAPDPARFDTGKPLDYEMWALAIRPGMLDYECIVLAAAIYAPNLLKPHLNRIDDSAFFGAATRRIARLALRDLREHGETDIAALGARLVQDGDPKSDVESVLTLLADFRPNAHRFAVRLAVDEMCKLRCRLDLTETLQDAAAEAERGMLTIEDAAERIEMLRSERATMEGAQLRTLADLCADDPADEPRTIIATGTECIDAILPGGGFEPGHKIALAGIPGAGKSALAMQWTIGALIANPNLHASWALGEMSDKALRNRILIHLSGLPLEVLRRPYDQLTPMQEQAKRGAIVVAKDIGPRLTFIYPPLTPGRIEAHIRQTGCGWLTLDYLQLARPDSERQSSLDNLEAVIGRTTEIANDRQCVSVWVSSSPKGATGSADPYASFKGSSSILHAADFAYVVESDDVQVTRDSASSVRPVRLKCRKARDGAPLSVGLDFDAMAQRFTGAKR